MLLAAAAAFAVPAVFQLAGGDGLPTVGPERIGFGSTVELLSGLIAAVLIVIYLIGLYLSLRTTGDRATELLVAAGHRRIAHITGEAWMEVSKDRLRGYREALATADIPFDPALVREGNWQLSSGYAATLELMKLPRPPTAIFCSNDPMAIGCYEALKQLRYRIPEDVSVVGFNDDEMANHLMPKLTTLKFPRHQMGEWAAGIPRFSPRRTEHHRVVKMECELVERESVAPLKSSEQRRGELAETDVGR